MPASTNQESMEQKVNALEEELRASKLAAAKLRKKNRYLAGMHELTLKLTSCRSIDELLQAIVLRVADLLKTGHVYISLYDEETGLLEIKMGSGLCANLIGTQVKATEGLAGKVFHTGKVMAINDYQSWDGKLKGPLWKDVESIVIAPVSVDGKNIGVVGIFHDDKGRIIDEDEVETVVRFSETASLILEKTAMFESSRKLNDELKTLHEITLEMTSLLSTDRVLKIIVARVANLVNADNGYVFLSSDKSDTEMELKVGVGLYDEKTGYILKKGLGLAGKVWETGKPMIVNDYPSWEGKHSDPMWDSVRSIAGVPLKINDKVIGVIGFFHLKYIKISENDLFILGKLAELATLSLNNSRLFEEVKDLKHALEITLEKTIQAVAYTVEIRDPYTAGHQKRVAQLACAIAKKMGLPEERIKGISVAATIHDIGKMYVPSELLCKPSTLMDFEFNVIKHHAQVGYDILKNIKFPWPVALTVYQHHEKLDGTGYPLKISGDEIILESRIIAVADVVEAISSHRPYRPSLGFEAAKIEILAKRGAAFDPEVVDVCLAVLEEGILLEY